ncbi:MAG TPA: transcriptional regulator [Bacillota bacterium]|nr:transcriptional regulator [Bacillota bacterium]
MQDISITKPTFKKTEAEWFNYHRTIREIKLLEDAIMHPYDEEQNDPAVVKGATSVRDVGSPTEITALRLTRHKQLNYLREIASAIETVYNELPADHKRLVHVRYWARESYKWDEIAKKCNVSRRQAFNWRDAIIHATIEVLGWR